MGKGYWVAAYRNVKDQDALRKYSATAGPLIQSLGGRILARGTPAKTYEQGVDQRMVIIEFDTVEKAIAVYESPEYQSAMEILKDSVERDLRIVEGL